MMQRLLLNPGILLIAVTIGWSVMLQVNRSGTMRLMTEGGFVEWLQVLFFALAALYGLCIARRGEGRLIRCGFLAFSLLAAFVALEEINWGQDILNLETPDFFKERNTANQISFHNLTALRPYLYWAPFVLLGAVGLSLLRFGTLLNRKAGNRFDFFLPPASFRLMFVLFLIQGIALAAFVLDWWLLGINYFSWAGLDRYIELGELGIAFTAFSYAYTRNGLLPVRQAHTNRLSGVAHYLLAATRAFAGGGGTRADWPAGFCPAGCAGALAGGNGVVDRL